MPRCQAGCARRSTHGAHTCKATCLDDMSSLLAPPAWGPRLKADSHLAAGGRAALPHDRLQAAQRAQHRLPRRPALRQPQPKTPDIPLACARYRGVQACNHQPLWRMLAQQHSLAPGLPAAVLCSPPHSCVRSSSAMHPLSRSLVR